MFSFQITTVKTAFKSVMPVLRIAWTNAQTKHFKNHYFILINARISDSLIYLPRTDRLQIYHSTDIKIKYKYLTSPLNLPPCINKHSISTVNQINNIIYSCLETSIQGVTTTAIVQSTEINFEGYISSNVKALGNDWQDNLGSMWRSAYKYVSNNNIKYMDNFSILKFIKTFKKIPTVALRSFI